MTEGLNVVLIGILGVFANLVVLMLLMNLLGTAIRASERRGGEDDEEAGTA